MPILSIPCDQVWRRSDPTESLRIDNRLSDILALDFRLSILTMSGTSLSALLQKDAYTIAEMPDGTSVLLDLENESLLTFNDTGAFMFSLVKDGESEEAIVAQVVAKYRVEDAMARLDVSAFIAQLKVALKIAEDIA